MSTSAGAGGGGEAVACAWRWCVGDCGGLEKRGEEGCGLKCTGCSTLTLMACCRAEGASDACEAVVASDRVVGVIRGEIYRLDGVRGGE